MRQFDRFDISVPIAFRTQKREQCDGVTKNFSITGCYVNTSMSPAMHSLVKLAVDLPAFGTIGACGVVLRVEKTGFAIHLNWGDKENLRKLVWYLFKVFPSSPSLKGLISGDVEDMLLVSEGKRVFLVEKNTASIPDDRVVEQLLRKSWASLIEFSPDSFFEMMMEWSSHLYISPPDTERTVDLQRPLYLGSSPVMQGVMKKVRRFSPTTLPVLLIGETGVGKEMFARMIHDMSQAREGPFVPVNCGAIPNDLFESVVFGHEKGAFTGAHAQQKGWFESTHGGTLFLDEIGEIPLAMQVKLLRVLQEKTFSRIGSTKEIRFDSRIIAATNKNLKEAVRLGHFREDLFYRIEGLLIEIPPLRERFEDILPLAEYLLSMINRELKVGQKHFSQHARHELLDYAWPGNVRELQSAIYRAVIVSECPEIGSMDLGQSRNKVLKESQTLKEMMAIHEKEIFRRSLLRHDGNVTKVSEELKISRPSVYNIMKKFNIRS